MTHQQNGLEFGLAIEKHVEELNWAMERTEYSVREKGKKTLPEEKRKKI